MSLPINSVVEFPVVLAQQVCGVHKPGGSCVSGKQLNECLQLCQQHAERVLETLTTAMDVQERKGNAS